MKHLVNFLKNRIWFVVAAVLFALLTVQGCGSLFQSSVALEQSVRCGTEEHVHSEDCYVDEILVCGKKAHTHGENCYIFRVGDNDINAILTDMGEKGINSLEDYMAHNLGAVYGQGQDVDEYLHYASVEELNAALSTTQTKALRLNADADLPATYAVTSKTPSAGQVGICIYLDGAWVCLDTLNMTETTSYGQTWYSVQRSSVTALYEEYIVDNITLTDYLYYSRNNPANGYSNAYSAANNSTISFQNNSARYFFLTSRTGSGGGPGNNNYTYTPVRFYTVTLDYSAADSNKADQVQYVQSGVASTLSLSDEYLWVDDEGNAVTAMPTTITETTTIYAKPKNHTVTYDWNYDGKGTYTTQSGIKNNSIVSAPTVPSRIGYDFGGWYTDSACTDGNDYDFENTPVTSSFTLYAKWNAKQYTATFMYNYAGGDEYTTQPIYHDGTVTKPADPTRDGFAFGGWYTDPDCTKAYDFSTIVTEDITLYAKWLTIHTVTWKNDDGTVLETDTGVPYGTTPTYNGATPTKAPSAQYNYIWSGWTPAVSTVTGDITYTATYTTATNVYTVTFNSNGGSAVNAEAVQYGNTVAQPTAPTRAGYTFGGWYTDASCTDGNEYDFDNSSVESSFTLYAKWTPIKYTLILIGEDDTEDKTTISYGSPIVLPTLSEGYSWINGTTPYSGGSTVTNYDGLVIDHDKKTITFEATNKHTVTYDFKDDTKDYSESVYPGDNITLPALSGGNVWMDQDGNVYQSDKEIAINKNTVFTERTTLTVSYAVNFPTSSDYNYSSKVTAPTAPTIVGENSQTVAEGLSVRTSGVSQKEVIAKTADSREFGYPIYFLGWETESGELISADSQLTWDQLLLYDVDQNGTAELQGKWSHGMLHTANFVVRYDSEAVDTNGNLAGGDKTEYTDCLFTAYVGGSEISTLTQRQLHEKYQIVDTTSDNSYTADQNIRALYGEKSEGIWLYSFPKDVDIFAKLKELAQADTSRVLTVDGKAVDLDKLDSQHYSIRWYVFKAGDSTNNLFNDGWHIDGKLVKKEGSITVDKLFGGVDSFIADGKDGFHVDVVAGTKNEDGSFTPFTGSDAKHYVLYLSDVNTVDRLKELYPDTLNGIDDQYFIAGTLGEDGQYHWEMSGMELGEIWQITEHPPETEGEYAYYAEYTVTDSDGTISAIAEYGTQASVVGKVYALDEDPDQGLTVDFSNYYYNSESILIKKEDADTGKPIGNTAFEFYQDGKLLQFELTNGSYTQNPDGVYSQITTADDGFSTIALNGFNFQQGEITVKEVSAPHGYKLAPQIIINGKTELQDDGTYVTTDIQIVGVEGVEDESLWKTHAEYIKDDLDGDGTTDMEALIIKDKSVTVDVIANKIWPDGKSAESVTLVLQANGTRATNVFPGIPDVEVVLNYANNWTYHWDGLPAYANGKLVSWSIKEIKIGQESTMVGSDNFAYWTHTYTTSQGDTDGDGVTEWYLTVANRIRRSMLILTKTDMNGAVLSDARFALTPVEIVDGAWSVVSGAASRTGSTDANGEINFDNLDLTVYYCLSEIQPPLGYTRMLEDVVLSLDGSGVIYVCSIGEDGSVVKTPLSDYGSSYIVYDSAYNLTVRNEAMPEFPATGDDGSDVYTRLGALLMLAAAAAVIYKRKGRKESDASAV